MASAAGASDILRDRGEEWSIELFDATSPGACPKMPLPAKPGAGEVLWLATSRTRRMTAIAFHGPALTLAKCLAEMAAIGAGLAPSAPGSAMGDAHLTRPRLARGTLLVRTLFFGGACPCDRDRDSVAADRGASVFVYT